MSESGEERALAAVVAALANTAAGRRFDLARVRSLADLQAHAPMMDVASHAREVEAHLGFGTTDAGDPRARELSGAIHERAEVTAVWRGFLRGEEVRRAIVLQAREIDGSVDRIVVDDLAALGAEVLRGGAGRRRGGAAGDARRGGADDHRGAELVHAGVAGGAAGAAARARGAVAAAAAGGA
jgi:hypothetical protein